MNQSKSMVSISSSPRTLTLEVKKEMMKMIRLQKSKTMKTKLSLKLRNGGIRLTSSSKNMTCDKEITVESTAVFFRKIFKTFINNYTIN